MAILDFRRIRVFYRRVKVVSSCLDEKISLSSIVEGAFLFFICYLRLEGKVRRKIFVVSYKVEFRVVVVLFRYYFVFRFEFSYIVILGRMFFV